MKQTPDFLLTSIYLALELLARVLNKKRACCYQIEVKRIVLKTVYKFHFAKKGLR